MRISIALGVALSALLAALAAGDDLYRLSPGEAYDPETYCQWNRTGLPAEQQKVCLDRDARHPPTNYRAQPGDALTRLIENCIPGGAVRCNDDVFQPVWKRLEADNGEVVLVDMNAIHAYDGGRAGASVYITIPGSAFDPSRLNALLFDCRGHYQNMTSGSIVTLDAPPQSVAGKISAIACGQ